jgi:hypothetical protein
MIRDIWEFYKRVDDLVQNLEENNLRDFGKRLKEAKAYNFTASEILGEISLVLKDFQSNQEASRKYERELIELLEFVKLAFRG